MALVSSQQELQDSVVTHLKITLKQKRYDTPKI
jgi:hypothetical protein